MDFCLDCATTIIGASACLGHGLVGVEIDLFVFDRPPKPFDEHVVPPALLPSIEMAISAFLSTAVKPMILTCLTTDSLCSRSIIPFRPAIPPCRAHRTKIFLQGQFADLGVKRFHIDGRTRRFRFRFIAENAGRTLKGWSFHCLI
ncbi:hypothetical protein J2T09_004571 [Neorhizobium huautlense]|uniref:Uncharacterized protein n=1 Tax=Neorhizobium huautlense TaxID=67774 RepID=A0ABT9PZ89_9HYPH|nr:hypothetical protein [Neorhizobium huautlense]